MTIDPRLYEKVTGRMPGDAQKAYGEALAKNAARKSQRTADREALRSMRSMPRLRNPFSAIIRLLAWPFLRR